MEHAIFASGPDRVGPQLAYRGLLAIVAVCASRCSARLGPHAFRLAAL
jgi:hypothetical protein